MDGHPEGTRPTILGGIPIYAREALAAELETEARVDEHENTGRYVTELIEALGRAVMFSSGNMTWQGWPTLPRGTERRALLSALRDHLAKALWACRAWAVEEGWRVPESCGSTDEHDHYWTETKEYLACDEYLRRSQARGELALAWLRDLVVSRVGK